VKFPDLLRVHINRTTQRGAFVAIVK